MVVAFDCRRDRSWVRGRPKAVEGDRSCWRDDGELDGIRMAVEWYREGSDWVVFSGVFEEVFRVDLRGVLGKVSNELRRCSMGFGPASVSGDGLLAIHRDVADALSATTDPVMYSIPPFLSCCCRIL